MKSLFVKGLVIRLRAYKEIPIEQDPAFALADMVVNTKYEDLTADQVEKAKKSILDTVAVIIGGSEQNCVPPVVDFIKRYKGFGEGRVLVYGYQVPAPLAGYANGTMARALDLGDCHNTGGHISEFNVPTMISAIGLADKPVTGKAFITAYAVGAEWGTRHHTAMRLQYHTTGLPGEAGWTWAGPSLAKMLGLNKDQVLNMMGICYTSHGLPEQQKYVEGRESVRLQHGIFADNVIKSAMMAKAGVTGPLAIYLGKVGFLRFVIWDDVEPEVLTEDLGKRWLWSEELALKPYASCKFTHTLVSGMNRLRDQHHIDWRDIMDIHCMVSAGAQICIQPVRWKPETKGDAMFSIPYCIAHAAMKGDVFLDAFNDQELADPEKLELMQKIRADVCMDESFPIFDGFPLEVTLKDGSKYYISDEEVPGNPKNPMSWKQLEDKFWKCVPYAAVELPKQNLRKAIELCKSLENIQDMNELVDKLIP